MNCTKNISHLRGHLFDRLDALCDLTKPVDIERERMICEVSKQIIDTARVEIQFAEVMNGALTLPFIEDQSGERPNTPQTPVPHSIEHDDEDRSFPEPPLTADERRTHALSSGPAEDHPWRGLGGRVHTLRR